MNYRILITGSSGLVGSALVAAFESRGVDVEPLDIKASGAAHGDVRDRQRVQRAVLGCDDVIHLAAVSRVIWGERDPVLCRSVNVDGPRNVLPTLQAHSESPRRAKQSSR